MSPGSGRYLLVRTTANASHFVVEYLASVEDGRNRVQELVISDPESKYYVLDTVLGEKLFGTPESHPPAKRTDVRSRV